MLVKVFFFKVLTIRAIRAKMFFLSSITATIAQKQPSIPLAISNQTELRTDVKGEEKIRKNFSTCDDEKNCEVDIGSECENISTKSIPLEKSQ